jgi:phosphate starvation-inducible PhoH-like protein
MPRHTTAPKRAAKQQRQSQRTQTRAERRAGRQQVAQPSFEEKFTTPPVKPNREPLVPLTDRQADYDDAIDASRITFGIGPAGTGKTYFATIRAAEALDRREIKKIYLTRPAVEAGEKLGFLPGELDEKYEPYLRPFRDALIEYFGAGHLEYLVSKKIIEPVPLGFLRGSTIKDAWLLADEMQNATKNQMKMLLTRMGKGSKFVVNGDPRQVDIPAHDSGLEDAARRLTGVEGVDLVRFTHEDVVRDDIVAEILMRYDD